jgi:hypothetical protein
MPLPYPTYGLSSLYRFETFQTREAYEAKTGQPCPPWDSRRPPKFWFDPAASASRMRNISYSPVLAIDEEGQPIREDGKPVLDAISIPRDEAATVNIPPQGTNIEGADVAAVPVPMRPLDDEEELAFDPFAGVVVRNKTLYADAKADGKFTAADRALLQRIAAKLGV